MEPGQATMEFAGPIATIDDSVLGGSSFFFFFLFFFLFYFMGGCEVDTIPLPVLVSIDQSCLGNQLLPITNSPHWCKLQVILISQFSSLVWPYLQNLLTFPTWFFFLFFNSCFHSLSFLLLVLHSVFSFPEELQLIICRLFSIKNWENLCWESLKPSSQKTLPLNCSNANLKDCLVAKFVN